MLYAIPKEDFDSIDLYVVVAKIFADYEDIVAVNQYAIFATKDLETVAAIRAEMEDLNSQILSGKIDAEKMDLIVAAMRERNDRLVNEMYAVLDNKERSDKERSERTGDTAESALLLQTL